MKNFSLILNVVLLLAVAFLYVKVFGGAKPVANTPETNTEADATAERPLRIVYVNADSLLEKYEEFKKQRDVLQKKEKDADASLKAKGRALEQDFLEVQKRVQTGTMSPSEIQREEQRLMQKQQSLAQEQERITKSLLEEGQKINDALQKELLDQLKTLKESEGYDFIFSYSVGGQILVTNDSLDITQKVLDMLNVQKADRKQ
jgi:outer membrane protein